VHPGHPTSPAAVLVVDDDPAIRKLVSTTLERCGYGVTEASDGREAVERVRADDPDLIVLDLGLPYVDGWRVLETVQVFSNAGVLVLTGLDCEASRVRGLQLGADDYVIKPFSAAELAARVEAILRRRSLPRPDRDSLYEDDLLRVDLVHQRVWVHGAEIGLTPLEFRLLAALLRKPGETITAAELAREVWHEPRAVLGGRMKVAVKSLRSRLGEAGSMIESVRGFGYRYAADAPA
jgi:two-component system phosphate regulon response regulator PhoB